MSVSPEAAIELNGGGDIDWQMVDLVKVDVEGYEPEVVHGLLPALRERRVRALMVDYHGPILARRALQAEDTHRRLLDAGMLCPMPGDLNGYVTYVLP